MKNKPLRIEPEYLKKMDESHMEILMLQTVSSIKEAISENKPAGEMKVLYDNLVDISSCTEGLYSKMKAHMWYLSTSLP